MIKLFSTILDDDVLIERIQSDKDLFDVEYLLVNIVSPLTIDILFRTFLEEPEGNLYCILSFEVGKEEIEYVVSLEEQFYKKHIGKFIDNIQRKIVNDIIVAFVTELEKIDWKTV